MFKKATVVSLAVVTSSVIAVALAGPAGAAAPPAPTKVVADWEMNEAANAKTMTDSGPNHLNGTIGTGLSTGVSYQNSTGYSWASVNPTAPPAKPQRLVNVTDNDLLNPGTNSYSVEIRYRTTHNYGNVIQKGQNTTAGGYWKFEQPGGKMTCLFKGGSGSGQRAIVEPVALNDGAWHTVKCTATATGLTMVVDNAKTYTLNGKIGAISNTWPLTIGGKGSCDQVKVTCDYFAGSIDYVKIMSS